MNDRIKKNIVYAFIFYLLHFLANPASASEPTFLSAATIAKHQKTITRVENYLSNLTTIVSEFTQIAPDGSISTGTFYLKRPGMMRWQYHPPTPILMVANARELIFYDYELEQITHIPLDSTLVGFLAKDKIRFSGDIGITKIETKDNAIRVQLAQKERPTDGQLMLELSDKPLQIRNMVVTDATGQVTTIALNKAQYGQSLDKELFIFIDPRKRRR